MTNILIATSIEAPINEVFDLSRNIDVHVETMFMTGEKAIAGVTSGLIELGETVTWKGTHFGLPVKHTSIITEFNYPYLFTDEMQKGAFKSLKHEHHYKETKTGTLMIDKFYFDVHFGFLGELFSIFLLKPHLTKILTNRANQIKKIAEYEFSNC